MEGTPKLSEEDMKAFKLYGKLPAKKVNGGVKYFDSGDYNMNLQGVKNSSNIGVGIPDPSKIPHSVPRVTHVNLLIAKHLS